MASAQIKQMGGNAAAVATAMEGLDELLARLEDRGQTARFVEDAEGVLEELPSAVLRALVPANLRRRCVHGAVAAIHVLWRRHRGDREIVERMAEAFCALGRPAKAADVIEQLVRGYYLEDRSTWPDALRLLARGLQWQPHAKRLRVLARRLQPSDRPAPVTGEFETGPQATVPAMAAG